MSLQRHVFPTYFATATALAIATAVTYPAGSVVGLAENYTDLGLSTATIGMSILNLLVYGPKTLGAMKTRTHTGMTIKLKTPVSKNIHINSMHIRNPRRAAARFLHRDVQRQALARNVPGEARFLSQPRHEHSSELDWCDLQCRIWHFSQLKDDGLRCPQEEWCLTSLGSI